MATSKGLQVIKEIYQRNLVLLDTQTLRALTGIKKDNTLLVFINSLIKRELLKRLEKGKYLVLGKPYHDFVLANFLYQPSYISLESALNMLGVLSQFPYETTSVTSRRSKEKKIEEKIFTYLHITPQLFWGFEKKGGYLIAFPEKALLDTLYFMSKGIRKIEIEELNLENINKKRLAEFVQKYPQSKQFTKLYKILENKL